MIRSFCIGSIFLFYYANAAPHNGNITHGLGSIKDAHTILQQSDKLIIDWQCFSICEGESVRFYQPSKTSAVLNRVIGNEISEIHGLLQGNGKIYLVNQNGIIVGPKGKIEAAAFVGSAFDIANEDFIARIDEDVKVMNGSVLPLNLDGIIELKKGSKIDAGTIIIEGKSVFVEKDATLLANGLEKGNGGKVILWGDEAIDFRGTVEAKGGLKGGDGGFVEISSPGNFHYSGQVTTLAPKGKTGTLLFDPSNITIDGVAASAPAFPTTPPGTYNPAVANATLNAGDVQTALALNNVFVLTGAGAGGNGTITVNGNVSITWSVATTFSLTADREIIFNSGSSISSTGTGAFTAMSFSANAGSGTGNFVGIDLNNADLSSVEGDILLAGTGGNTNNDFGIQLRNGATITSSGTGVNAADITLVGTGGSGGNCSGIVLDNTTTTINSVDGDITLTGTSNGTGNNNRGILVQGGSDITSTGTATITLNGTGSAGGSGACVGILVQNTTTLITSIEGDIALTGIGGGSAANNFGVHVNSGAVVSSTGSGASAASIIVNGTGGPGTNNNVGLRVQTVESTISAADGLIDITATSNGTNNGNQGVFVSNGAVIQSTGTSGSVLGITIDATGGNGNNNNQGVLLQNSGSTISTVNGPIGITATGNGGGTTCHGLLVETTGPTITSTGTGDITVVGTGVATSGSGIRLNNGQIASTSSGDIDLTATGSGVDGFVMNNASDRVGSVTDSGNITISTNTITLAGQTQSTGNLLLQPIAPATSIGLATGAAGTFNLTSTELSTLQDGFTLITVGRSNSAAVVDMRAFTYLDPLLVRGTTISVNGAIGAGANNVTLEIGVVANGTLNLNANVTTTGTFQVNGAASDDNFNINVGGQTGVLNGGGGTNILTGPNLVNAWTIDGNNAGTLYTTLAYSNMQRLIGGTAADSFTFTGAFQISGTPGIDGGAGTNTITAPNVITTFNITGANSGNIVPTGALGPTSFVNIQNFVGGSANDAFVIAAAGSVGGSVNGGGGSNTLDYSAFGAAVAIDIAAGTAPAITGGFTNIQNFIGGAATDTLTGPNTANTWLITGDNAGSINGIFTFTSFEQLVGGTSSDNFTFNGAFQISGTPGIDGGAGTNTITAPNVITTFNITGANSGNIVPAGALGPTSFVNIQNLTGGSANDTFILSAGASVAGTINGGGGSNTLDYSAFAIPVSVDIGGGTATSTGGIASLQNFIGGAGSNSLAGPNTNSSWIITGANDGTINGIFSFTDFENLTGGFANDVFDFSPGFLISGLLNGGGGRNTLIAPNLVNNWNLTGNDAGDVAGITFVNITDLTGGNLNDTFIFSDGVMFLGQVNGGGGFNTLDYTAFTVPVMVIFLTPTSGMASNLGDGFINIQSIIGNFSIAATMAMIEGNTTDLVLALNQFKQYFILWNSYEKGYPWFDSRLRYPFDLKLLYPWRE